MLNDTYLNRANSIRAINSSSQTEKWSEKKLYWVSQIAGWSVFAVVNLVVIAAFSSDYALGQFKSDEFKIASPLAGIINLSGVVAIWSLIYFSFHYFQNYKRAEIESYIWEAAVKDFELKTLKSQLNPHFMLNALNSIRALIEEDPKSAQTAVTKLSNILR